MTTILVVVRNLFLSTTMSARRRFLVVQIIVWIVSAQMLRLRLLQILFLAVARVRILNSVGSNRRENRRQFDEEHSDEDEDENQ